MKPETMPDYNDPRAQAAIEVGILALASELPTFKGIRDGSLLAWTTDGTIAYHVLKSLAGRVLHDMIQEGHVKLIPAYPQEL